MAMTDLLSQRRDDMGDVHPIRPAPRPDRSELYGRQVPPGLRGRIMAEVAEAVRVAEHVERVVNAYWDLDRLVFDWADDPMVDGAFPQALAESGLEALHDVLEWISARTGWMTGTPGDTVPESDLASLRATVTRILNRVNRQ